MLLLELSLRKHLMKQTVENLSIQEELNTKSKHIFTFCFLRFLND